MEFMDISLLGYNTNGLRILEFKELCALPIVKVSMDLKLLDDEENIKNLEKTIALGSAVANIRKINLKATSKTLNFPKRILFEMTNQCNVLCKMCPRNNLLKPAQYQSVETYKRVLDEFNSYGVDGVWLYRLGESLLHPGFREIVNYIKGLKNVGYIWMGTNGRLNESIKY